MTPCSLRRVYDPPRPGEGLRVLVDRLWPRGVAKDRIDLWLKEAAPSESLRRRFHAGEEDWAAFRLDYLAELAQPPGQEALARLHGLCVAGPVILLYAVRDETHNNAAVLREALERFAAGLR